MIPIKIWAKDVDDATMRQAENLASLPFAREHVALMADAHLGYGMPIGGVLVTKNYVIPNAVGVDIGCGVLAVRTTLKVEDFKPHREDVLRDMENAIPRGYHRRGTVHPEFETFVESIKMSSLDCCINDDIIRSFWDVAATSFATLGGGNHFIEFDGDDMGNLWILVHSGSRGLGKGICDHYNGVAKEILPDGVDVAWDLAPLHVDGSLGESYIDAVDFCVNYARFSRVTMCNVVTDILADYLAFDDDAELFTIDTNHNDVDIEWIGSEWSWIHRKGAVRARKNEIVVIPGSMGTASYIAIGRGNDDSFNSCSHGAGRAMGRRAAMREFSVEELSDYMVDNDIVFSTENVDDLVGEISYAYKNIEDVMDAQKDLVVPLTRLTPVAVFKG